MKHLHLLLASLLFPLTSSLHADDAIAAKVLELFPQTDRDGDGALTQAEVDQAMQFALRRYPEADADGDGKLSLAEQRTLLQRAEEKRDPAPGADTPSAPGDRPTPTHAEVSYGDHERNVFDLWLADSEEPAPLAIYIHGGGFTSGSKEKLKPARLAGLLDAGISVASINYRYASTHQLPTSHHDSRRALQFLRANADEWNLDKSRVAVFGGSAGAQIAMWIAYSDDMANPESEDAIARESTRVTCVATTGGQTFSDQTLLLEHMTAALGDAKGVMEAMSRGQGQEAVREELMTKWAGETEEECKANSVAHKAVNLVSSDDPPIFMSYGMAPGAAPPKNRDANGMRGWLIHHVFYGEVLKEKTDALGLEAHLSHPGAETPYETLVDFISAKLQRE